MPEIICAAALDYLHSLPDNSVDCVVTSPPYFGLRKYNTEGALWHSVTYIPMVGIPEITTLEWRGELGAEPTVELYVGHLVEIFRETLRVLKPTGVFWLNISDTYVGTGDKGEWRDPKYPPGRNGQSVATNRKQMGIASKNLLGIPWRVAFALQADGWILRMDSIWSKQNGMPESVTDRFAKAHEYVFQFAKSGKYYFDSHAVSEPVAESTIPRSRRGKSEVHKHANGVPGQRAHSMNLPRPNKNNKNEDRQEDNTVTRRTRRSVLHLATAPSAYDFCSCGRLYIGKERQLIREKRRDQTTKKTITILKPCLKCGREDGWIAHFAAFPRSLIEPLILAGCPEQVCSCCGTPYKRIIERRADAHNTQEGGKQAQRMAGVMTGGTERVTLGVTRSVHKTDLGFVAACDCDAGSTPGIVLDVFMGSGTTAMVAEALGRSYLGCDANPDYVALAQARLARRNEDPQFRDGLTTWHEGTLEDDDGNETRYVQTMYF